MKTHYAITPSEFSQPVAVIKNGATTFEIHAYRAGQSCRIAKEATLEFGASIGSKSAGLVYVVKDGSGLRATDLHVDEASIWTWIQDWMQKGMDAEKEHAALVAVEKAAATLACELCSGDDSKVTHCRMQLKKALDTLAESRK